jgi:hypothetical protein
MKTRMKITSVVTVAAVIAIVGCTAASAGVVAQYSFDNDGKIAGQTAGTVLDETANNNDGTGVLSPTYSSSVFGTPVPQTGAANTLSMDMERGGVGADDYISVPDSASLDMGDTSYTIEAWVKFNAGAPVFGTGDAYRKTLVMKKGTTAGATAKNSDYEVLFSDGGPSYDGAAAGELVFVQGDGGSNVNFVRSGLTLTDSASWHYVSVAFDHDGGTGGLGAVRFIIDNSTATVDNAFTAAANNLELWIGANIGSGPADIYGFDGLIDELRISDEFLPPSALLNAEPATPGTLIYGL